MCLLHAVLMETQRLLTSNTNWLGPLEFARSPLSLGFLFSASLLSYRPCSTRTKQTEAVRRELPLHPHNEREEWKRLLTIIQTWMLKHSQPNPDVYLNYLGNCLHFQLRLGFCKSWGFKMINKATLCQARTESEARLCYKKDTERGVLSFVIK